MKGLDVKNFDDLKVDYSQESRHKKVKNIQEKTKDSAPSIELLPRLE